MLLASSLAKLGDLEQAAAEYRAFLRLAPNDPKATRVRRLLELYEESKRAP